MPDTTINASEEAGIVRITKRQVALVLAAVIVLPIHHPLTVAHQWATLDFVSGGRAILAVGLGRTHH